MLFRSGKEIGKILKHLLEMVMKEEVENDRDALIEAATQLK